MMTIIMVRKGSGWDEHSLPAEFCPETKLHYFAPACYTALSPFPTYFGPQDSHSQAGLLENQMMMRKGSG